MTIQMSTIELYYATVLFAFQCKKCDFFSFGSERINTTPFQTQLISKQNVRRGLRQE